MQVPTTAAGQTTESSDTHVLVHMPSGSAAADLTTGRTTTGHTTTGNTTTGSEWNDWGSGRHHYRAYSTVPEAVSSQGVHLATFWQPTCVWLFAAECAVLQQPGMFTAVAWPFNSGYR